MQGITRIYLVIAVLGWPTWAVSFSHSDATRADLIGVRSTAEPDQPGVNEDRRLQSRLPHF